MVSIEFLTGQNGFFDVDRTGFQKLGCFYTSRSALSEVIPRYAFGHGLLLDDGLGSMQVPSLSEPKAESKAVPWAPVLVKDPVVQNL